MSLVTDFFFSFILGFWIPNLINGLKVGGAHPTNHLNDDERKPSRAHSQRQISLFFFLGWRNPNLPITGQRVVPSRNIPEYIIHFTHWKCPMCNIWCYICHILWNLTITRKNLSSILLGQIPGMSAKIHPFNHNSKVPIRIHKRYLQIILQIAKCGLPCEGRGKWIMDHRMLRLGPTLARVWWGPN